MRESAAGNGEHYCLRWLSLFVWKGLNAENFHIDIIVKKLDNAFVIL